MQGRKILPFDVPSPTWRNWIKVVTNFCDWEMKKRLFANISLIFCKFTHIWSKFAAVSPHLRFSFFDFLKEEGRTDPGINAGTPVT